METTELDKTKAFEQAKLSDTIKKRRVGRPPKFENVDEMMSAINAYLEITPEQNITVTGMCLYIGLTRETFLQYQKKDEYAPIIKQAKLIVENAYEINLRSKGRTGDIFALKNFGWVDKREVQVGDAKNTLGKIADTVFEDEED